jgi:PPP family 3-phenylpropionic acid transporter
MISHKHILNTAISNTLNFKISAFYFFYFMAVGIYLIFLPKILLDFNYTPSDIGIALSVAPLMRFLIPFLFLKKVTLTQTIFKYSLVLALFASIALYYAIEYFWAFVLVTVIKGGCLSIILPYIDTIAINHTQKNYGKVRLFGSIGFAAISLILAQVLTSPYIALHFYLGAIVITAGFSLLILKFDNTTNDVNNSNIINNPPKSVATTTTHKEFSNPNTEKFSLISHWQFWLSIFLMQTSFGGFYNFFTIYETENGLSLETVSYLWAFGVLCEVLMFVFQAPLLKRNLLNLIKIAIFITIIRWLLLYLFPNSLMVSYLSQSLHAFGFSMYYTACVLYLFSIYQNKKLAQQFMLGLSYGLGAFVGAIVAGQVYGQYLFLVFAGIALLALISIFKLKIATNSVFIPLRGKK